MQKMKNIFLLHVPLSSFHRIKWSPTTDTMCSSLYTSMVANMWLSEKQKSDVSMNGAEENVSRKLYGSKCKVKAAVCWLINTEVST